MLIKLKAITNGTRHQLILQKNLLYKSNRILKAIGFKKFSGRSSITGRITVRHKGGGCKYLYRTINFTNKNFYAIVVGILYDPNRTSFISLNFDLVSKCFFYTAAIKDVNSGAIIICKDVTTTLFLGCRYIVKIIPTGALISLISKDIFKAALYIRSAGVYGQLIQKEKFNSKIKLPSGKIIVVNNFSYATLGTISNPDHQHKILGKAGVRRLAGIRPSVRGIAMNPVDHPHGGRSNGGMPPVTPWGKLTRGKPTVKKKTYV